MERMSARLPIKSGAHVLFTAFLPAFASFLIFHPNDNVVNAQFIAAIFQIKFIHAHTKMTKNKREKSKYTVDYIITVMRYIPMPSDRLYYQHMYASIAKGSRNTHTVYYNRAQITTFS